MAQPDWEQQVLDRTKLDAVFLTNNFDDPLEGFDTKRYVPCLRTDDLVFHLAKPEVRQRLEKATNIDVHDAASLRAAIGKLFEHFVVERRAGLRDLAAAQLSRRTPCSPADGRHGHRCDHCCKRNADQKHTRLPSRISSSGRSPNSAPSSSCRSI